MYCIADSLRVYVKVDLCNHSSQMEWHQVLVMQETKENKTQQTTQELSSQN